MSEIKTLTVNGRSYTVADPDAAHIDDTAVGEKAWSSRRIMEAVDQADSSAAIVCRATGSAIAVSDASDRPLRGLTLYGKTTQNGTPTPESPVPLESAGAAGSMVVNVYGKNLFYTNNYAQKQNATVIEQTENGATFRGNEGSNPGTNAWSNGWAMIDGTSALRLSAGTVITVSCDYTVLEKHSAISGNVEFFIDGISMNRLAFNIASAEIGRTYRISNTATVQADGSYRRTHISLHSSKVRIENLQWAIDTTAADFTPYTKQTLTVPTPNGLPGIPVSSGGNYTDESGQAWICDEIDFARGVYVQRIGVIESYTGEAVPDGYLSSEGSLTAGAQVQYALADPMETPLSAEELAGFAALHSNKPISTIVCDAGAGMAVAYIADTKRYIDNKLAAISAAMLNM